MVSETNWGTGNTHPYSEDLNNFQRGFSNGYVPLFVVVGNNNNLIYIDNSPVSALTGEIEKGIESFNYIYVANEIDNQQLFFQESKTIDLSSCFDTATGSPITYSIESNSNSNLLDAEINSDQLIITGNDSEGVVSLVVQGEADGKTSSHRFYVLVREDLPNLLFNQADNPLFRSIPSQDFESSYDQYDCMGADDFVVPAGETWMISEISASGNESSKDTPFDIFNIVFYQDDNGGPGDEIESLSNCPTIPFENESIIEVNSTHQFTEGKYWVSVQTARSFSSSGQWFWSRKANPIVEDQFYWKNPGNGFGNNAPDWTPSSTIYGSEDNNLAFNLYGSGGSGIEEITIKNYKLSQNYPNPFNPTTTIDFSTQVEGKVNISVFNSNGELVKTLIDQNRYSAGDHSIMFDGSNLNSGVYYYRISFDNSVETKKMVLLK